MPAGDKVQMRVEVALSFVFFLQFGWAFAKITNRVLVTGDDKSGKIFSEPKVILFLYHLERSLKQVFEKTQA